MGLGISLCRLLRGRGQSTRLGVGPKDGGGDGARGGARSGTTPGGARGGGIPGATGGSDAAWVSTFLGDDERDSFWGLPLLGVGRPVRRVNGVGLSPQAVVLPGLNEVVAARGVTHPTSVLIVGG